MPRSTAPLACTTPNAPPTTTRKAMMPIAAPSRLPEVKPSKKRFSTPGVSRSLENSVSGIGSPAGR